MPRTLPQHALARRAALTSDSSGVAPRSRVEPGRRRRWVQHGVALLGVSVLGLGAAASAVVTGNAENSAASSRSQGLDTSASYVRDPGVERPTAFDRRQPSTTRSDLRPELVSAAVGVRFDQLLSTQTLAETEAQRQALAVRTATLAAAAQAADKKQRLLAAAAAAKAKAAAAAKRKAEARERAIARAHSAKLKAARALAAASRAADAKAAASRAQAKKTQAKTTQAAKRARSTSSRSSARDRYSLPVTSGYRIAARFGDTGSWARYHTGIDFSASMGTRINAVAAGVVTHAGSGSAGWAGRYVTIRHADGRSTLYAHMSSVSVHVGQRVDGGRRVGSIGMTGRTFGPHVHFEVYPQGVTPGDPYRAVNPVPWLHGLGLYL